MTTYCFITSRATHTWKIYEWIRTSICTKYINIIAIQRITMCPNGYHHSGSMATPALGTRDVRLHIVWIALWSAFIFFRLQSIGHELICTFSFSNMARESIEAHGCRLMVSLLAPIQTHWNHYGAVSYQEKCRLQSALSNLSDYCQHSI